MESELPASFRDALIAAGLLLPSGVAGLYGRSGAYDRVAEGLQGVFTRLGVDEQAEVMRFPPGSSRVCFEQSGYLKGFPHLAGTIHCFCGDDRAHRDMLRCVAEGEDWTRGQVASEIVLTPAACYPAYPVLAERGPLPDTGKMLDVASWCFRHEPSLEPTRQQMFQMREYVCLGTPAQVLAFRQRWLTKVTHLAMELGLPHTIEVANDPFFGRSGRLMAESQRQGELKFEMLVPVNDGAGPTACVSFNYHLDHFAQTWPLRLPDGSLPHSACIGIGIDRLVVALFRHHGLDWAVWPESIRRLLWP